MVLMQDQQNNKKYIKNDVQRSAEHKEGGKTMNFEGSS